MKLILGDCFASSAIRCCFVDTDISLDVLSVFPNNSSVIRHPPSLLTGSLGAVRLSSSGTMRALRLPFVLPCTVRLSPMQVPCRLRFVRSLARQRLLASGQESFIPVPLSSGFLYMETSGSLTFRRNPLCIRPALRPRSAWVHLAFIGAQLGVHGPIRQTRWRVEISGLNDTASASAVYASCRHYC